MMKGGSPGANECAGANVQDGAGGGGTAGEDCGAGAGEALDLKIK